MAIEDHMRYIHESDRILAKDDAWEDLTDAQMKQALESRGLYVLLFNILTLASTDFFFFTSQHSRRDVPLGDEQVPLRMAAQNPCVLGEEQTTSRSDKAGHPSCIPTYRVCG